MEFVETPTFTRLITALLTDDEYRELQNTLLADPERGAIVRDGGGIRKMRFAAQGRRKSGGVRTLLLGQGAQPDLHAARVSQIEARQLDRPRNRHLCERRCERA